MRILSSVVYIRVLSTSTMARASNKPFTARGFRHKLKITSDMSDLLVLCEGPATMSSEFWELSLQCLGECVNVLHHFNLCWGWSCIARIS